MAISKAILIGFGYHGKDRLFKSLLNLTQVKEILVFARNPSVLSNVEAHINGNKIRTTSDSEEMGIGLKDEELIKTLFYRSTTSDDQNND